MPEYLRCILIGILQAQKLEFAVLKQGRVGRLSNTIIPNSQILNGLSFVTYIPINNKTASPIGRIIHTSSFKILGIGGKAGNYELMLTATDSNREGQRRTHFNPSRPINFLFVLISLHLSSRRQVRSPLFGSTKA